MRYFYITAPPTYRSIIIPFTPKPKTKMDDFILFDNIFQGDISNEHMTIYMLLIDALKENNADYFNGVGEMLLEFHTDYYDKWANHCFVIADKIRNRGNKKYKKNIPFYSSEDSAKKFRRLLEGGV